MFRTVLFPHVLSSWTSLCNAATAVTTDLPAGRSLLHYLVSFLVGMVVVPLFRRFLSWFKDMKSVPSAVGQREDDMINDAKLDTDNSASVNQKLQVAQNFQVAHSLAELIVDDDSANGKMVGKLFVSNDEIADRRKNFVLRKGTYKPDRLVAIKLLDLSHCKNDEKEKNIENDETKNEIENETNKIHINNDETMMDNEIVILCASDAHPNIIRFHGCERQEDFAYLCLEQWKYSLLQLTSFAKRKLSNPTKATFASTEEAMLASKLWKAVGVPSPLMIGLIRNVVSGLEHLHKLRIIHRNLTPSNVLITCISETLVAKLSDMRISKKLPKKQLFLAHHATWFDDLGWEAPEQLRKENETFATDMFRLGCVIYYALTGDHPFGRLSDRNNNIMKNKRPNVNKVTHPEASHLIHSLLNPKWDLRPTSTKVLNHPMFWSSQKRLYFLRDASDRIAVDKELWPILYAEETKVGGLKEWNKKLDNDLVTYITRVDKYGELIHYYDFNRLRHLLRLIRNEINHYWEIPQEIRDRMKTFPEGYESYFTSRFPQLFIVIYQFVSKHFMEEKAFESSGPRWPFQRFGLQVLNYIYIQPLPSNLLPTNHPGEAMNAI